MTQSILRKLRRKTIQSAVKAGTIAPTKRDLNPAEILELQEIDHIARSKAFEVNQMKANSALLPARRGFWPFMRGNKTEMIAEAEAVARLLANVRSQWVRDRLAMCGYPPDTLCDINLATGKISITKPDEA